MFHFTRLDKISAILKANAIMAKIPYMEKEKKVSLTLNHNHPYHGRFAEIVFVFDDVKISKRFKTESTDGDIVNYGNYDKEDEIVIFQNIWPLNEFLKKIVIHKLKSNSMDDITTHIFNEYVSKHNITVEYWHFNPTSGEDVPVENQYYEDKDVWFK